MNYRYRIISAASRMMPSGLRAALRRRVSLAAYDQYLAEQNNLYVGDDPVFDVVGSPSVLGILHDPNQYHARYIAACRELGVSYRIVDISGDNWLAAVRNCPCDAWLAWPSAVTSVWKDMLDDRMRIMVEQLGAVLFPTLAETWLYENKRRTRDWLMAHSLPGPHTWVFFHKDEALQFVNQAEFPLVLKTNCGAAASGVQILRRACEARRMIHKAFARGISTRRNPLDRHRGSVLLQEYLPDVREWRMIRIGDSYFGYEKGRRGEFHSGTHLKAWSDPPRSHLDMLREVTEIGGFRSMNVDLFETRDGRLLVNELHTVFGQSTQEQMRVDDKAGRYRFDPVESRWTFEEGDFARNACANLRVEYLITKVLGKCLSER